MDTNKKILVFLKRISTEEFDTDDKYQRAKEEIRKIYSDRDFRHHYSDITAQILKSADLEKLVENLRIVKEGIEEDKDEDSKHYLHQLTKLWDHINLEFVRVGYYKDRFSDIENRLSDINKSIENTQNGLQNLQDNNKIIQTNIKDAQIQLQNLKKDSEDIQASIRNQQNQYITILGIFASIVLTLVGGFIFSTSVFANIDKSSIYRLVFMMIFICCFTTNILYYLFRFIKNIGEKNPDCIFKDKAIVSFNILMLFILICDGGFYLFLSYC
ncbi:hypothetical protein BKH42_04665 [Helicobacter sp. 13S00482-2]|uniref:hypothetical protein n=1 Tax=Helicobacter sp. 13S00482-2 TaxID=1476200 RepID=UPI000BA7A6B7|nr:hypothetical protein [Helicobacter sp. 13S00482-2]PAF53617.1 hypothetical protein BKH42_04665 [Helicobacter sp. 13S00482-2]